MLRSCRFFPFDRYAVLLGSHPRFALERSLEIALRGIRKLRGNLADRQVGEPQERLRLLDAHLRYVCADGHPGLALELRREILLGEPHVPGEIVDSMTIVAPLGHTFRTSFTAAIT